MSYLYLAHLSVFTVAALLCLGSIPRARSIKHDETREGFVAILLTCSLWAIGYLGYFLLPTPEVKVASYIFGLIAALACVGAWLYFSAAYTGRSPRQAPYPRLIVGGFLGIVLVKVTNPIHQLYFTTTWVTEPFPHLALHQGILHWIILAISYVVIGISFFILLERFYHAGTSARPLVALVGITALPIAFNIYGVLGSSLLPIWYEPFGVAIFSVGTLFVYFERFEAIQFAGDTDTPTIFLDRDWTIRDTNLAATTMFPELDEGIGQSLDAVLPMAAEAATDGDPNPIRINHEGSPRYYHVSTTSISTGEVVTGRVLTLTDVSEQEQYRRRLERQNERLERFASIVSHDLRNPLSVAEGYLELARETGENESLDKVARAHDRMFELIEDLLELAKSGMNIGETETVELANVVHDCWQMIASAEATLTVQEDLGMSMEADRDRLGELFENLFRNAIEHGGSDVAITVGTLPGKRGFYVEDTGPGIPEADHEKVLEPGYSTAEDGTGFGLAIVKEIVEAHGWEIRVTDGTDGGARFEISGVESVE
ncbi:sensor histidine kinase [Halopenitus persicus]|uniref:histidine kinase n=1 Tax=Halopenitus persicus TaxID=1048396 RepID=A0A1H3JIK3_9EURY|nr:ATP-binding protein [Halopenitus persicus]SDY39707.1 His Kinase A (phospho-acceptor) domain-containing protein [Halopenitus persicus]